MPFDDEPQEDFGGGHDPHDNLDEVTDAMIDAAVLTGSANGTCLNCAMQLVWVKITARMLNSLMESYVKRLRSAGYTDERKLGIAAAQLVGERVNDLFGDAKTLSMQIAQEEHGETPQDRRH